MFKSLRSKFISITMAMVGLVLAGVLSATFYSAWGISRNEISRSLDMALEMSDTPQIGIGHARHIEPDPTNRSLRIPVVVFTATSQDEEITYERSENLIEMDESDLREVVEDVFQSASDTGSIEDAHIAWKRQFMTNGWRIAVADTEAQSEMLLNQAGTDLIIFGVAMLLLFLITNRLANWALSPVESAWEGQKRFVADASHELKTPLAVILANSEILQSRREDIDADSMRWIESTAEEAHHMHSMVEGLLQLARADEMKSLEEMKVFEDTDLSALVEKVTLQFDAVAFESGSEIDASIDPDIHLECDATQIENLVSTLVENSCKYAKPGTPIKVLLKRDHEKIRLRVTNYGDPIPEEDLPHVFDRFWRSDASRTRQETGGFGLGLAIAKAIVETHGGTIEVHSSVRDGTTFCVDL